MFPFIKMKVKTYNKVLFRRFAKKQLDLFLKKGWISQPSQTNQEKKNTNVIRGISSFQSLSHYRDQVKSNPNMQKF